MSQKEILIPNIGDFESVEVIEVHVSNGDAVEIETPLLTLESDKASMDIPSPEKGVIKSVKVKAGDMVSEGDLIMLLEVDQEKTVSDDQPTAEKKDPPPPKAETPKEVSSESVNEKKPDADFQETDPTPTDSSSNEIISFKDAHASPSVRKFARELGVNLNLVTGSGRKGRVLKSDVQSFVKNQLETPKPAGQIGTGFPELPKIDFGKFGPIDVKPMSRIQKKSSANLQRNWVTIPHVTQFEDADITETEAFRKEQKEILASDDIKLTLLPFIMKAAAYSLKKFPDVNASLDVSQDQIIHKKYYHIGLAVDTPNGLVVVVVKDVDQKDIKTIAVEVQELAERARQGKLKPEDTQGGSFTISNLGGIGGTGFTPIINAPEVAILGVSKAVIKPVFKDGAFVPRSIMPISFSYDHRVVDGALAARFTGYLAKMIQDIRNLIM